VHLDESQSYNLIRTVEIIYYRDLLQRTLIKVETKRSEGPLEVACQPCNAIHPFWLPPFTWTVDQYSGLIILLTPLALC
jgi:hypothetical protein